MTRDTLCVSAIIKEALEKKKHTEKGPWPQNIYLNDLVTYSWRCPMLTKRAMVKKQQKCPGQTIMTNYQEDYREDQRHSVSRQLTYDPSHPFSPQGLVHYLPPWFCLICQPQIKSCFVSWHLDGVWSHLPDIWEQLQKDSDPIRHQGCGPQRVRGF